MHKFSVRLVFALTAMIALPLLGFVLVCALTIGVAIGTVLSPIYFFIVDDDLVEDLHNDLKHGLCNYHAIQYPPIQDDR